MGIFDEYRNQNLRLTYTGDRNRAAGFAPRAKKIIERAQGLLDLGSNLGFQRSTRFVLDADTILDLKISPGVTGPIISGNITAKTPEAISGAFEAKSIFEGFCPPLPEPRPGNRMFTQLFDGNDRDKPESQRAFKKYDTDKWRSFGQDAYSCTYDNGNVYNGTHSWINYDLKGLPPIQWRGSLRESWVGDNRQGLWWGTNTGRFEIANGYTMNDAPCKLGCIDEGCGTACGFEDGRNYIHPLAGVKFGGFLSNVSERRAVRYGTGLQWLDVYDSDGNQLAVERTAHVFQRGGQKVLQNVDRNGADFIGSYNRPDVEVVFLRRDPYLGCPGALGIFYNADDGVGLFDDDQGAWTSVEGLRGWGDIFAQDITPDSYDLNWFCQNAVSLFPILGPPTFLGTFPRLQGLQIMGENNAPIAYATPNINGELGYANAAYAGRAFWLQLDSQGFFTKDIQVSEDIYYSRPGTSNEITFLSN